MSTGQTPGVYIEEISNFPPSVISVPTAIPAFIGYTQKAMVKRDDDLVGKAQRIRSMIEYEKYFGKADTETGIVVDFVKSASAAQKVSARIDVTKASRYLLYYAMQMFFANGGGDCYVVPVNTYSKAGGKVDAASLMRGMDVVAAINEVTLIVLPEAVNISGSTAVDDYYKIFDKALAQANRLKDRFVIMDVFPKGTPADMVNKLTGDIDMLKYGASYYPRLFTNIRYEISNESKVMITGLRGSPDLASLKTKDNASYQNAKAAIAAMEMLLPASSSVAGCYSSMDNARGVWKAPANINISQATRPEVLLTDSQQSDLNVPISGKSINVIRSFPGKGNAMIWGARTLAGNHNEWRYIPVRRFFNMVEASVKIATQSFAFEPNDANTWVKVKGMLENYLTNLWRSGALMGTKTNEAFFVHVGLGQTMTALDISEGRLIVEIGMAVVRPAEFIILTFMVKMDTRS